MPEYLQVKSVFQKKRVFLSEGFPLSSQENKFPGKDYPDLFSLGLCVSFHGEEGKLKQKTEKSGGRK